MFSSRGTLTSISPAHLPAGGGPEFNMGEWAHSSTLRDITDGDPTCPPPSNAEIHSTGRAIDLTLLDPGACNAHRWGRLGLLTSGHHTILIALGGQRIPRVVRTRIARFVYKTEDRDAYAESVKKGLASVELEWQTRNPNESLTSCILDDAKREIRKNNPTKTACNLAPIEVTRLSNDRERLYASYKETGSAGKMELIHAKYREITNLLARRRKKEWGVFLAKYGLPD